jgi:Holliday junction resolvasome RuvABC endonuclease subunit
MATSKRKKSPTPSSAAEQPTTGTDDLRAAGTVPEVNTTRVTKFPASRDPAVFLRGIPPTPKDHVRILALDLGSRTGVAFLDMLPGQWPEGRPVIFDLWDMELGTYENRITLLNRLRAFLTAAQPTVLGFENVTYTMPQIPGKMLAPAQVAARVSPTVEFFGTLKAIVSMYASDNEIPCHPFDIGTIKKYATGKGNASKQQMIESCNKYFGTNYSVDNYDHTGVDNIADASAILRMLIDQYSQVTTCN